MTHPTHLLLGPPLPPHVETILRAAMQGAGFAVSFDPRDPADVARALDALDAMRAMLALPSSAPPVTPRCAMPESPTLKPVGFVGYPKLAPGRQPAPPRTPPTPPTPSSAPPPTPSSAPAPLPPKAARPPRRSIFGLVPPKAPTDQPKAERAPRSHALAGRPRNAERQYPVTPWSLPYVALPSAPLGLHGYEQVLWELWAYGPRLFADMPQRLGVAKSYSARMIHTLLALGYLACEEVLRPVVNGPSKIIALAADGPWLREWVSRASQGQTLPQYVRRPAMPRLMLSILGPVAHILTATNEPPSVPLDPLAPLRFKVRDYPLTVYGLGSTPLPPPIPTITYPPRNLPTYSIVLAPSPLGAPSPPAQTPPRAPQAPLSPANAPQQLPLPTSAPVIRKRTLRTLAPEVASVLEEWGPLPLPVVAEKMDLSPADLRQNLDAHGWGEVLRRPILDSPHLLLYLDAQASLAAVCAQEQRGYQTAPRQDAAKES